MDLAERDVTLLGPRGELGGITTRPKEMAPAHMLRMASVDGLDLAGEVVKVHAPH